MKNQTNDIFGILGGMGPLASAAFVQRIYEYFPFERHEQHAPRLIQYSDPSIPDRSTAFLAGEFDIVLERLLKALNELRDSGATRFVVCCFTMHHIFNRLPEYFQDRTFSLVEVLMDKIKQTEGPFLFLCTTGTRNMKILEQHAEWSLVKDKVLFLSGEDQLQCHELIYKYLKMGKNPLFILGQLHEIVSKYEVETLIAGCTEFHLLSKNDGLLQGLLHPYTFLDPLDLIAENIAFKNCITIEKE